MMTIFFILICLLYVVSFAMYIRRRQIGANSGFIFGVMYLGLIPFGVLLSRGHAIWGGPRPSISLDILVSEHAHILWMILAMYGVYAIWDQGVQWVQKNWAKQRPERPERGGLYGIWIVVAAYFGVTAFIFIASGLAGGGHWAHARADFNLSYGTLGSIFGMLHAGLRISIAVLLCHAYLTGRISILRALACLAPICLIDLYTTGNRIFTLQVMVLFFALMLINRQWKVISIGALAAIPFGFLMMMWSEIRSKMHDYPTDGLSGKLSAIKEGWLFGVETVRDGVDVGRYLQGITEANNLNIYATVIQTFPVHMDYLYGSSIAKSVLFWIPRTIWPNKPLATQIIIGDYIYPGLGVSLNSTIFGEFYMNFGLFGILLIPFALIFFSWIIKLLVNHPVMSMLLLYVFGFTFFRMALTDAVLMSLFAALVLRFAKPYKSQPIGLSVNG